MTFFDIGAHYGYFSLLGSILVGKGGKVYSFEPTPSTFDILKTNTSKKKNIVISRYALSSNTKKILLNDYGLTHCAFNSLYSARITDYNNGMDSKRYHVDCITVDEYITEKHIKPNFIKIDAESSEYDILLGMDKCIEDCRPIITVEVGDFDIKNVPQSNEIIRYLLKKNYQPYEYKNGNIIPHKMRNEKYLYDNILFLPK